MEAPMVKKKPFFITKEETNTFIQGKMRKKCHYLNFKIDLCLTYNTKT